jgi:hypothetical protein
MRALMLVNYRPEHRHEWGNKSYYSQLRLHALGWESAAEMLSTLLGDGVELDPLKRLIKRRQLPEPARYRIQEREFLLTSPGGRVVDKMCVGNQKPDTRAAGVSA